MHPRQTAAPHTQHTPQRAEHRLRVSAAFVVDGNHHQLPGVRACQRTNHVRRHRRRATTHARTAGHAVDAHAIVAAAVCVIRAVRKHGAALNVEHCDVEAAVKGDGESPTILQVEASGRAAGGDLEPAPRPRREGWCARRLRRRWRVRWRGRRHGGRMRRRPWVAAWREWWRHGWWRWRRQAWLVKPLSNHLSSLYRANGLVQGISAAHVPHERVHAAPSKGKEPRAQHGA